jgi:hypothetical protein
VSSCRDYHGCVDAAPSQVMHDETMTSAGVEIEPVSVAVNPWPRNQHL